MKIKPARQNELALYCWAYTAGALCDFLNPENRGALFDWSKFDGYSQALEIQCVYPTNNVYELEVIVETCKEIANQLKERARLK